MRYQILDNKKTNSYLELRFLSKMVLLDRVRIIYASYFTSNITFYENLARISYS